MLGLASSLSARELIADATPLKTVVEIASRDFGTGVKLCSEAVGARLVTGRFDFRSSADIAGLLLEKGFPVSYDGIRLSVGCDQASMELDGTASANGMALTSPFAAAVLGGDRDAVPPIGIAMPPGDGPPQPGYSAAPVAPPPPPPKYRQARIRYRDPSSIIATLAKLPGLSVIADPAIPGPLLLAGPASIVDVAADYLADLDTCPVQVQIEAAVIASSESTARNRSFGLQLHSGSTAIGGFDPTASATISIPGLRVFLNGLNETGQFRQNSTLKSRVIVGHEVKVQDGQDVPIRAATSVTDRETRQDVIYRNVGHRMAVKLLAVEGEDAVLLVDHELSSQTGNGSLGPVFTARSLTSTMRVRLGQPAMISLSGSDTASKTRGRGIFSRSDATDVAKLGAFLVFALEQLPCAAGPGPQRSEDRKPAADGDAKKGGAKSKKRS
jgi:hypothetical protein